MHQQKYIVNCQEKVEPPVYLRSLLQGQVTFDLTPIVKKVRKATFKRYEVNVAKKTESCFTWP